MRIILAEPSGACYGVERALDLADQALRDAEGSTVYTLGPLIHNPIVVGEFEAKGVKVVHDASEVSSGCLVIRSHGVPKGVVGYARQRGLIVVDATCPHVRMAQREAFRLAKDGRFVMIVGEHGHPEVVAIESYSGKRSMVVQGPDEIPVLPQDTRIGVVVQTTQPQEKLDRVARVLSERYSDIEVCNTICTATRNRQQAARDAAVKADAVIVIGGRNSGNTTRLADLCREQCPDTYHIESAEEIDPGWFKGCETVAVTAGASTPQEHIRLVVDRLASLDEMGEGGT